MAWWIAGFSTVVGAGIAYVDWRQRRIPNLLVGVLALLIWGGFVHTNCWDIFPREQLIGVVVFVGPWLAAFLASPASIGAGDVKLALALAPLAGAGGMPTATFAVVMTGVIFFAYRMLKPTMAATRRSSAPSPSHPRPVPSPNRPLGPALVAASGLVYALFRVFGAVGG